MERLLGRNVTESVLLSEDALRIRLEDGDTVVVKRVPRQSRHTWKAGEPWAELVALDVLSAEGGPVPKLLAADLVQGRLVQSFVEGVTLRSAGDQDQAEADRTFAALDDALLEAESILERASDELAPFTFDHAQVDRSEMFEGVARLLTPTAAKAWRHLVELGFDQSSESPSLGSLDLQPDNAITDGRRVTLIDFSSLGRLDRERRLVAYVHRALPVPGTLLHEGGYAAYARKWGRSASLRLAAYDFAFLAPVLSSAMTHPAKDPTRRALSVWQRRRFEHPLIEAVRLGLNWAILQEMSDRC